MWNPFSAAICNRLAIPLYAEFPFFSFENIFHSEASFGYNHLKNIKELDFTLSEKLSSNSGIVSKLSSEAFTLILKGLLLFDNSQYFSTLCIRTSNVPLSWLMNFCFLTHFLRLQRRKNSKIFILRGNAAILAIRSLGAGFFCQPSGFFSKNGKKSTGFFESFFQCC